MDNGEMDGDDEQPQNKFESRHPILGEALRNTFLKKGITLIFGSYATFSIVGIYLVMHEIRGPTTALDLIDFTTWTADGSVKRLVWLNVLGNYVPGVLTLIGFIILHIYKLIALLVKGQGGKISPEDEDEVDLEKGSEEGQVILVEDMLDQSDNVETDIVQPIEEPETAEIAVDELDQEEQGVEEVQAVEEESSHQKEPNVGLKVNTERVAETKVTTDMSRVSDAPRLGKPATSNMTSPGGSSMRSALASNNPSLGNPSPLLYPTVSSGADGQMEFTPRFEAVKPDDIEEEF